MPQFDSSAFWGIVGIIVGIIVATIFFLLGKKKTLLQYYKSTTPLITEKMAGILNNRMSIDGQPVKSLVSTTISFVNSGNQRIQSSEFSDEKPLRVILTGHLYGYDVSLGNQKLRPKVEPVDEKTLNISFENLKPRQFFRVTILHDKTIDVSGELTTGTMRVYSHSVILLIFQVILIIICIALMADYGFKGPVAALIGDYEMLLVMILALILLFFWCVDVYKEQKGKKLFINAMP